MSIQNLNRCRLIGEILVDGLEKQRVRDEHVPGQPGALGGDMTIEAKPTWYGGTTFRSALEAGWAATLDSLGIAWEYEPETITLPSGVNYIPDLHLPELGTWLEVKGTGVPRIEKAIELGESRTCHCEDACACQWPGGELVLIGRPPVSYIPPSDPDAPRRRASTHGGHPNWSTSHGRSAWLARCPRCARAGWFTAARCRACRSPFAGAHAYRSCDPDLEFIRR